MFHKIPLRLMAGMLLVSLLFSQVLGASAQSSSDSEPTEATAQQQVFLPLVAAGYDASANAEEVKASTLYANYKIVAVQSGKCLDVYNALLQDQAPIILYTCHSGYNQKWTPFSQSLGPSPSRAINIAPFNLLFVWHSQKCMDIVGGSLADQAVVQQYTCHGGPNQQWYLIPFGSSGNHLIVSRNSGKCLDVAGGSLADYARIQQYRCHGGLNQQFRLQL